MKMKQLILLLVTFYGLYVIAEPIEFTEICAVPLGSSFYFVGNQLLDADGDGTDEILIYSCDLTANALKVQCYEADGIFNWEKTFPHSNSEAYGISAHATFTDDTLYLLVSDTSPMVELTLYDLSTETLLDTHTEAFGGWGSSSIFSKTINDELCCFIGLDIQGTGYNESKLLKIKVINDELTNPIFVEDCGIMAMDLGNGTHFTSLNSHGSGNMGYYSGCWETKISTLEDLSTLTTFCEQELSISPITPDTLIPQYCHCIANTPGAIDKIIIYYRVEIDFHFSEQYFNCYDLSGTELWSNGTSLIGYAPIDATSWLPVNGEDHYILYTRGELAEIRDTETGEILHHQAIPFPLAGIETNSENEHFFFSLDAAGETLNIYTLAQPVTVGIQNNTIPQPSATISNYPNPFNPSTEIIFSLNADDAEDAKIEIFNTKGQMVKELDADLSSRPGEVRGLVRLHSGEKRRVDISFTIPWDGTDTSGNALPSGIYFSRLTTGHNTLASGKMLLMK